MISNELGTAQVALHHGKFPRIVAPLVFDLEYMVTKHHQSLHIAISGCIVQQTIQARIASVVLAASR